MVIGVVRTIILYLLIILGIRLMGKRQVGELEPSELVLDLIIADLAAVPMQDFGIPLLAGVVPILTLLCITMILSVLTMKSSGLRAVLCGRPSIVIQNGAIVQKEMRRNRFTIDELNEELRLQGITDLSTVKYALLETNGRLSVLPYANQRPATAEQLGLGTAERGLPTVLVEDGLLHADRLKALGLNEGWLRKQLAARGLADPREVFLLTVDEAGGVYFAPREVEKG